MNNSKFGYLVGGLYDTSIFINETEKEPVIYDKQGLRIWRADELLAAEFPFLSGFLYELGEYDYKPEDYNLDDLAFEISTYSFNLMVGGFDYYKTKEEAEKALVDELETINKVYSKYDFFGQTLGQGDVLVDVYILKGKM